MIHSKPSNFVPFRVIHVTEAPLFLCVLKKMHNLFTGRLVVDYLRDFISSLTPF